MELAAVRSFLGWCTVLDVGLLAWWFLFFWLAHDWMYAIHGKLFRMSVEVFDAIHYAGMAAFKINIFLFNLVPYLVLSFLGGGGT